MVASMTAFASNVKETSDISLTWELKSVNHRYMEVSFHLPDEFVQLENDLKRRVSSYISRGKLSCYLHVQHVTNDDVDLMIDNKIIERLSKALNSLHLQYPDAIQPTLIDMLRWPGAYIEKRNYPSRFTTILQESFEEALEKLRANRLKEGSELMLAIQSRVDGMRENLDAVKSLMVGLVDITYDRIKSRLAKLNLEVHPDRLEQEVCLFAQRVDISEEVERIELHLKAVHAASIEHTPQGRRLDFLMQELNREVNTLASKAVIYDISRYGVDMKVLIEQMREQIQNIE